mmetsp:Transcript_21157/g.52559  ORF Transcript_21157/g.52559 Transcript_21157/m.52559 type:complete len:111 (+) Transcript_21157:288-620(+)
MFNNARERGARGEQQDPESLERDNDAAIGLMSDRVAMLKKITTDIHAEADSHHRYLDGLADNMEGVSGMLGTTMKQFNQTFVNNKNGRQCCYMVAAVVCLVWLFHYMFGG